MASSSNWRLDLWIDAGVRDQDDLSRLVDLERTSVVVGLETVRGPEALQAILDRVHSERVVMSLDLFEGIPRVSPGAKWSSFDPEALCREMTGLGIRRMILLDLSRVGTGRGTGTGWLVALLRAESPWVEVTVGGGVAGVSELQEHRSAGASAVLVGSALHDGRLGPSELASVLDRSQ